MKFLIIGLLMSFSVNSISAKEACVDCEQKLSGLPEKAANLSDVKKLVKYPPNKRRLIRLAQAICTTYNGNGVRMASNIKKLVTTYMKTNAGYKDTSTANIIKFLNQNKDEMTCGKGNKNYMMAAFDNGAPNELFKELFAGQLFLKKEMAYIDINAVSYSGPNGIEVFGRVLNGNPITVLDYIDLILADKRNPAGFLEEVKSLRNMYVKYFNAKHFTELPKAEQQRYLANQPK